MIPCSSRWKLLRSSFPSIHGQGVLTGCTDLVCKIYVAQHRVSRRILLFPCLPSEQKTHEVKQSTSTTWYRAYLRTRQTWWHGASKSLLTHCDSCIVYHCTPHMNVVIRIHYEDHLGKGMATHSSILARKIPWTEKPGRLQSMGSQRVRHNWVTSLSHF